MQEVEITTTTTNPHQKQQPTYHRLKLLGTGSFGKAYLVQHTLTNNLYVIKQIDLSQLSEAEQQNTRTQAKLLQILDHPNIIKFKQIYTTFSSEMKLNIVMEYADGGDLAALIKDTKNRGILLEESFILDLFTQVCLGVKHMHDRKITHRDLKGQNVFLTAGGCVKIGDLGVARVLEHTVAKAKTVVGSPYYMSPQIIENKPYSFKTDIWSLGVILYEMCALQPPFTANNIQFLALKIVRGSYPNIPQQYSQDLKNLIKSMLNTNVNHRPNINQILSCPLINRRIKSLLTQSQNQKQFSHTVLHKFNALKGKIQDKLRPPPNLMEIQQDDRENYSVVVGEKKGFNQGEDKDKQVKVKTPYCYGKNAPPIKKKIGVSDKKVRPNTAEDLTQIMKIKPSQLQQHMAIPKLPKVSPNPIKKKPQQPIIIPSQQKLRPQTPKQIPNYESQKMVQKKGTTSTAFNKKKSIDCTQYNKQQIKKGLIKKIQIKIQQQVTHHHQNHDDDSKPTSKHTADKYQNKSQTQLLKTNEFPNSNSKTNQNKDEIQNRSQNLNMKKNSQKIANIKIELNGQQPNVNAVKKQVKKDKKSTRISQKIKSSKPIKTKEKKQVKIQLLSEQMKIKEKQEKKKVTGKIEGNKKNVRKGKTNQQKKSVQSGTGNDQIEKIQEIVEEEKCNDPSDTYDDEQFEPYEEQNNDSDSDSEMSFALSDSSLPDTNNIEQQDKKSNDYNKMMAELQLITKLVDEAKGKIDCLPVLGQPIPQLLQLSNTIRHKSSSSSTTSELLAHISSQLLTKTESCLNNLGCIGDQSQLQNLRIALEQIFGVDSIIKAYKYIENIVRKNQLDFNEEDVIRGLLKECTDIQETMLRRHFRLIVTVIVMENQGGMM